MSEVTEEEMQKGEAPADDTVPAAVPQDDAPTDWRERENPYRGAKAVDSDKVFKILLAVVLVGLVAVAAVLAVKVLGHREQPRKADVEPTMHEAEPEQEASFEMPLLSKPQPEGQPVAVDAGDDDVTREFLSTVDVYEEIPVAEAAGIQSEGDAVSDLRDRGLAGSADAGTPVSSMYDMDGTYLRTWADSPVAESGTGRHPTYSTAYMSEATGILWSVSSQNGRVSATPVLRAGEDDETDLGLDAEVVISEEDTLMSYDSHGDRFWRLLPRDGSESVAAKVARVDAQTLDKIGIEELRGLMP